MGFDYRARDMSGGRQSSESSKRMRATPPSPISRNVASQSSLAGGLGYTHGGPSSHLSASGTSTTAAVARYVDDDVNFLRDLREINRVKRDQIDRDTPIDARIHSTISNGIPTHAACRVLLVVTSPPVEGAKYCDDCVCLSVCPIANLKNDTSKLHEIYGTCGHGSVL